MENGTERLVYVIIIVIAVGALAATLVNTGNTIEDLESSNQACLSQLSVAENNYDSCQDALDEGNITYFFEECNCKEYDGLYMKNIGNHTEALSTAREYDPYGDWIAINIYNMTSQRAYDTCVHECSHAALDEMFAEECETNVTKCRDLIASLQ